MDNSGIFLTSMQNVDYLNTLSRYSIHQNVIGMHNDLASTWYTTIGIRDKEVQSEVEARPQGEP